jgi:ADP-ribosylglycohydrolase
VVESLEAALWCFQGTSTFAGAVLAAANLGDDADTTAAVCGQIAGAFYGAGGIPERWLRLLAKLELMEDLAERLGGRVEGWGART